MTNVELTSLNAANAAQRSAATETPVLTQSTKTVQSVLSGDSVTVTNGFTDLEKLVAQLKSEGDEARQSVAQRRIAAVIDVLGSLSAEQTAALESAATAEAELSVAESEKAALEANLSTMNERSLVLDVEIDALEKAVKQNIEDGKIHREKVEELKRVRAEQATKLQAAEESLSALESAEVRDEDAIAAAQAAVSEASAALAATDASIASHEAAAAEADSAKASNLEKLEAARNEKSELTAKIAETTEQIAAVDARVAALEKTISAAFASLGESALASLASALVSESKASVVTEVEDPKSPEEIRKEELKDIENDPSRFIREAMDRVAELLEDLKTIGDNRSVTA